RRGWFFVILGERLYACYAFVTKTSGICYDLHGVCFSDTPGAPRAVFVEKTFNFGNVKQGGLTHKFQVKNEGTAPLLLDRVDFNLPGLTAKFKPEIPPGGEGFVQVDCNTASFSGPIDLE